MEQRSFDGVSAAAWQRMQDEGRTLHGTVFAAGGPHSGTATTGTPLGELVLGFEFDPEAERITYTILRKPMLVASSLVWGGIAATLERCRRA